MWAHILGIVFAILFYCNHRYRKHCASNTICICISRVTDLRTEKLVLLHLIAKDQAITRLTRGSVRLSGGVKRAILQIKLLKWLIRWSATQIEMQEIDLPSDRKEAPVT